MGIERVTNPESDRFQVEKVLVAGNRGPCGGVNMALQAADQVLSIVNGREQVWTNWPVVNNRPISKELEEKGLRVFNNNWELVPDGSIVIFSAHGVAPKHHEDAKRKGCFVVDTTCQLVTRVHNLAIKAEKSGEKIVYIGVSGHPETEGVLGELQEENKVLIEKKGDVANSTIVDGGEGHVVYSQTTLMPTETIEIEKELKENFPKINIPNRFDLCYATLNRQGAVEKMIESGIDMLMVVGSPESHNSQMLKGRGELADIPSYSIDYSYEIDEAWFSGAIKRVGLTSGASVLDRFMEPVVEWIKEKNDGVVIEEQEQVIYEDLKKTFKLPVDDIRRIQERYGA